MVYVENSVLPYSIVIDKKHTKKYDIMKIVHTVPGATKFDSISQARQTVNKCVITTQMLAQIPFDLFWKTDSRR